MNWLRSLIKIAQSLPLSINGLLQLRASSILAPDIPGQAYLFQGPEVSELARLRGRGSPTLLDQIIKMMHNVFSVFGEDMKNEYDYDREIDDSELEDTINDYAAMYMEDYRFSKDDMWSIVEFFSTGGQPDDESSSLREAINDALSLGIRLPDAEGFQKLYEQLKETELSVVKFYNDNNQGDARTMSVDSNSVFQAWQEAIKEEADGLDGTEIFADALTAFTSEVLQAIVESENSYDSYYDRNRRSEFLKDDLPSWLDENKFQDALREDDRAIEWYIDKHRDGYGGLRESAIESQSERDSEYFEERKREWEHKFGFDIIEFLAPVYDPEDEEDPRRDVSLTQISEMAQAIASDGFLVKGGGDAAQKSCAIIFAIKELASQDENMKFVFSNDLNKMTWDSKDVISGIELLCKENSELVFGPLADQIAQIRQRVEEQRHMEESRRQEAIERERAEEVRKMELQQRLEDEQHQMLPRIRETTTPEQLQKMRELGIAKRPFGYETQLNRGSFPGAGVFEMQDMYPFTISIAPTKEYVDQGIGKIPPELLNTAPHKVKTDGQPPLGWIGGFADYTNKTLYIAEVQSDLMQRTVYMRDPKKLQKQREQEVATIQQQIADTQAKMQNVVSPKQQITQKLDAIRQENMSLPQGSPKLQRNQGIIDNLLRQLPNVPDTIDTTNLEMTLQNLNRSLTEAQQRLQEPSDTSDSFQLKSRYQPWHDYKSKVENTFKEWIPLFFNSAFRLARDKQYEVVRIATSESLKKLWGLNLRPETSSLFERIYDQTAKFYGAQLVNIEDKTWWEVKMTPDTRIANWLQRLIKIAQARSQWLVQNPNTGKYVWQVHLDVYMKEMKQGKRPGFQTWLREVPSELKIGNDLEPSFKQAVRQYLLETQDFDPYVEEETDDVATPTANEWLVQGTTGKYVWQNHLDVYFQKMKQHAPELMGEQWEAQSTDYAANEGKRSVFQMWLGEVPSELKMGDDLEPSFKHTVRQYLLETQDFDPYEFEETTDDVATPTADELNSWLG